MPFGLTNIVRHDVSASTSSADPVQNSQICHGKSPLSQPALIVSDPVQISQIRHGKYTLSHMPTCQHAYTPTCRHADMPTCLHTNMPELNMSDLVRTEQVWSCPVLQIRDEGKKQGSTKRISKGLDVTCEMRKVTCDMGHNYKYSLLSLHMKTKFVQNIQTFLVPSFCLTFRHF